MPYMWIPVMPGTTIYEMRTNCCDLCITPYLSARIEKEIDEIHCNSKMLCHTVAMPPSKFTFDLETSDITNIIKNWNVSLFATEEEAINATNKLVSEHRKRLEAYGIKLDKNGKIINMKG